MKFWPLYSLFQVSLVFSQDNKCIRNDPNTNQPLEFPGYYGKNCNTACSPGCQPMKKGDQGNGLVRRGLFQCDATTGKCNSFDKIGCQEGWISSKEKPGNCDVPKCFSNNDKKPNNCAYNGNCVAPNYCVCGKLGAQVVGKKGSYDVVGGKNVNEKIEGINCVSLRADGFKGSLIALAVMTISISFCGILERSINGDKRMRLAE